MNRPALLDTSVYVALLRYPDAFDVQALTESCDLWLSAVVLEELYAGAGRKEARVIEVLKRSFAAGKRLLVPGIEDWKQAGRVLARLAARYGFEQVGADG